MTAAKLLAQMRAMVDELDALLGVNPGTRVTPYGVAHSVIAKTQPVHKKRGRPKGSKNKPKAA